MINGINISYPKLFLKKKTKKEKRKQNYTGWSILVGLAMLLGLAVGPNPIS